MARCAVPTRVVAGGTNIRATLAFEEVAPLHAARTSQRDVPTTLNTNGVKTPYLFSASQRRGVGTDAAVSQSRQRLECGDLSPLSSASASQLAADSPVPRAKAPTSWRTPNAAATAKPALSLHTCRVRNALNRYGRLKICATLNRCSYRLKVGILTGFLVITAFERDSAGAARPSGGGAS